MSLFSHSSTGELILIVDVQSSIVRGSVVSIIAGKLPDVVFTYNAVVPWKPHTDSSYLIKMTLRAVSETIEACMRGVTIRAQGEHTSKKVTAVHFALSSPWIVSQAKTLTTEFAKDTQISKAYVEHVIEEERRKLTPTNDAEVSIIEQKIFDVRLNGYSVAAWMGKWARTIDVSYTMSMAGTRMIERFRETCSHLLRHSSMYFHSSLLLQFIGMRICMPEQETYALVHVHGELTDVAIMDHNACVFFGSYPLGVRTLTRKIATATGTEEQAADSLLTLYVGGHVDATHGSGQVDSIANISAGWNAELKKVIEQSGLAAAPSTYIISATAHDDFFAQSLRALYPRSSVEPLSIENILPHITFSDHAERRRLTGLYAAALSQMM